MPLRTQYVHDVGINPSTYPTNAEARISKIYQTARRGTLGLPVASRIWKNLEPLYQQSIKMKLPTNQSDYDQLVVQYAFGIGNLLHTAGRGGFGIGQKIVNLFMKDLWALGIVLPPTEHLLHAPLDRIVLSKLRTVPSTWSAWTKVIASHTSSPAVADYLYIQKSIRTFHSSCPIPFPSVIQMEQFIWHRI